MKMKTSRLAVFCLTVLVSLMVVGCSVQDSTQPAVGSISAEKSDFTLPAKTKAVSIKK